MNEMKVNGYEIKFTDNEESTFILQLNDHKIMEVPMWSFYLFISEYDDSLSKYSDNFPEWEKLTHDLIELNYNFKSAFDKYIQQFDDEQMDEFTETEEGYDYEFDYDDEFEY
jgi:hypothetical protein